MPNRNLSAAMIDDLRRLVEIESPSADADACRAAGDELISIVEERLGVRPAEHVEGDRRHLLWRFGQTDAISVLLVGHVDTVFPIGALAERPFNVDEAGIARGPGVFDMKSGLVQAVHAVGMLDDPSGVALFVNDDEEVGSPSSQDLVATVAEGVGAALVLEGASGGADALLKTARKGVSLYEARIGGRSAHAGMNPEDGANALVESAHMVLQITELADSTEGTTVTPTVIVSGDATNVIPNQAVLKVDVRANTPGEQQRVDLAMRALRPTVPGTTVAIHGGPNRPPMPEAASASLLALARRCAVELDHPPLAGVPVGGGSDASFIAPLGVPVLDGLGGVGGGGHQPDEWCDTNRMVERARLVAALIDRIRSGALTQPSA